MSSGSITGHRDRLQLPQIGKRIDAHICLPRSLCVVFAVVFLFVVSLSPCAQTCMTDGVLDETPSVSYVIGTKQSDRSDHSTIPFTDVNADMWYAEAAAYGVKAGYFYGNAPNNTFGGELSLNRAMMVTLL